jgi:hypothetical protein
MRILASDFKESVANSLYCPQGKAALSNRQQAKKHAAMFLTLEHMFYTIDYT